MQITPHLEKKIVQAVQTSMLIEGCKARKPQEIKDQAKNLMEQHCVQVYQFRESDIEHPSVTISKNRLGKIANTITLD